MLALIGTTLTLSSIGTNIVLTTAKFTCSKAVDAISNLTLKKHESFEDFHNVLTALDVSASITKISFFISSLEKNQNDGFKFTDYIETAIIDVNNTIYNINVIINDAAKDQEYQKTLWFHNWNFRKYDCTTLIDKIQLQSKLLDVRFKYLLEFISTYKFLHQSY